MQRTMTQSLSAVAIAASLALACPARAATTGEAGGVPGEWLMSYTGARTLGLGGAYVASADDALGVLWNPAGLQRMDQNQLMFENVRLFEETSVNSFGFAVPGSRLPSFGLGMVSLRSGEFERTNEMNDALGTFRETETAYLFTLAKSLSPRIALGANLKLVQQGVEDFSAGGYGFDVGAIVEVAHGVRLGAAAANLGGPSVTLRNTAEEFPTEYRGGVTLDVLGGRGMVATQVDMASGADARLHAGAEYWIQSGLALRVGYDADRATGGFSYRFTPQYQLDYGVADHPLGMSHRVGVSYRFGGFFASSKAEPEVFSPTGERATTQIRLNAHTKTAAEGWSLEIVDKRDQVVRRFSGPGLPPPHVQWDGKDETGLPVADGRYTYRMVVKDRVGRALQSANRQVEISTGGPQMSVPIVPNP